MSRVYIRKIRTGKIENEIKAMLAVIGYFPKRKRIFIKPNVAGFFNLKSPCIVNPRVVGGVIEYLRDNGYKDILIGELPISKDTNGVFNISGYRFLSKKYNVGLTDLNSVSRVQMEIKDFNIGLPKLISVNEYEYINVAKMKTHISTSVSMCTKNQMGLLDFSSRKLMHKKGDLHENITILGRMTKPDFCIIDGINALEGDGPGINGKEINGFNIIIFGKSMEAVDWIGTQLMGLDPGKVRHLMIPTEEINIIGEDIEKVKRNFILPKDHYQKFNVHLWLTGKTCFGCSGIMREIKRSLIRSPASLSRFLYRAFCGRLDILTGDVDIPDKHGKIICIGNCMEEKAKLNNLALVKGCPPDSRDVLALL